MRATLALRAAKYGSNAIPAQEKYTLQSTGIWETIRRALSIEPARSSGVPLNSQFRYPSPGALSPLSYDDPVTIPAGDIADNPYWKRDVRRNYPRLSVVNQSDVVGLLTVGSQAAPKDDVLQIGDAGVKQLVEVKQAGEERGLAAYFEQNKAVPSVLESDGLPPRPVNLSPATSEYKIDQDRTAGYPDKYPCRMFV